MVITLKQADILNDLKRFFWEDFPQDETDLASLAIKKVDLAISVYNQNSHWENKAKQIATYKEKLKTINGNDALRKEVFMHINWLIQDSLKDTVARPSNLF